MSTAFQVILTGAQEVSPPAPPGGTGSTATGIGMVLFDDKAVTASYEFRIQGVDFSGQQTSDPLDNVTKMHFHTAQAGVNGPVVFGQIDNTEPRNVQDRDDLDIVQNADGSWTV